MDIASVCILGGSGFVGRALAEQLSPRGIRVRIVTRLLPRAMPLTVLPTVELMVADPHDGEALKRGFEDMDAVINLVGILHGSGTHTFQSTHVDLPRKAIEACHAEGVQHFLHMSALGASPNGPSEYLRSKGEGEAVVRRESGILPYTIFRPSVIFGERDHFLNLFARLLRWFPVVPLAGSGARFQPIWVEDVARCFSGALGAPGSFGKTYDLCGPRVYTLREIVELTRAILGVRRAIVPLADALARLQAAVLEHLPGKLMTRDNLRSMSVDNVCGGAFPDFGFEPSPMEAIVPDYLVGTAARARYPRFRTHAGR